MRTVITKKFVIDSEYSKIEVYRERNTITVEAIHGGQKEKIMFHKNDILELEAAFRKCLEDEENG